ncbi:MAG: hypothetical protein JSV06_08785 [Myxococcales bacterium]|nr:MAG: hypothetical protein JSV06_08785 [Myxococcales bacterium]
MSRNRRDQRRWWLWITAVLAALSAGCASSDSASGNFEAGPAGTGGSAGTRGDGGPDGLNGQAGQPPFLDASAEGVENNPIEQLFADPQRSPLDFLTDAESPQGYVDAAVACYSEPGACEASECAAFASCCVATGRCCKPVVDPPLPESLDFRSCDGLTLDACTANELFSLDVFGEQEPVLTAGGLVPNGTATSEGGALLGDVVDLASERALVEVQFSLPVDCSGSCLQSAGVAFTPNTGFDEFGGAEVGLLLSGSRGVVSLMIGGQVADSFDAGSDATTWLMVLSPTGMVEVERNGIVQGAYPFDSESLRDARFAFFGRNLGANDDSAAIARIAAQIETCDNPRAWDGRAPLSVTVRGNVDRELMMGREPSIAAGAQFTAVAFELDGQIFVGQEEGDGLVAFATPDPTIFPTEPFEAGGVGEPELFWFMDELFVFYTGYDAGGAGRIGSAVVTGNVAQKSLDPVLTPQTDVLSYDSPTVMLRDDLIVMIARATLQSGVTELHAFYSVDPNTGWARIVDGTLEQLTRIDDPTSEIDSPSLIVHNSAYHLYYARRIGTRWTIELAVSDELLFWRPLGEALGASGEGFDSLGARGADAQSVNDRIEMVYMGQDGVSFRLGYASRAAPADTALTAP